MNNLKNFIWWIYQPNDEREQQLYLQAYKRVSYVFIYYVVVLCIMYCLDAFKEEHAPMAEASYVILALIALVIGLIWGAFAFHNQTLSFTKSKRPNYYWLFIRNGLIMCVVLAILYYSGLNQYIEALGKWLALVSQ